MSQDKTLPRLPVPDVLEAGYEPGTPPDAYSAAAVQAYGERCVAAHLERTGQSVTNDAVPDLIQSRFLMDERHGWTPWRDCTEEQLVGLREAVDRNTSEGWRHEVRRLYLHPATPPEAATAEAAGKAPARVPSYEVQCAIMEGERNAAVDAYLHARPSEPQDIPRRRRLLEAGFDRGWDAALAAHPRSTT